MKFTLNSKLKELITSLPIDSSKKAKLLARPFVTAHDLRGLYLEYKPTSSLLQLISKTTIYKMPETVVPPKDPQFLKNLEKLRLKQQEFEYQQLVHSDLMELDDTPLTIAQFHKEVRHQVTTIFNILLSVVSVAYAVWYWTGSSMRIQDSYRILLSLFFGLLVLVAEVVVYMGYLNKIEDARAREGKKKEIRTVIETVTLR